MTNPLNSFQNLETTHKVTIVAAIILAIGAIVAALVGPATEWFGLTGDGTPIPTQQPTPTRPRPTVTQEPTFTPTPDNPSRIQYAATLQLIACDQTNDAREFTRAIQELLTDFILDPSPERVANFLRELRDMSGTIAAVTKDSIEELEATEPPAEFRQDHQTLLASLRNINDTYNELLLRTRDLGDNPSLEQLDSLLASLLSTFSAGLAGIGQEEYSSEFEALTTCMFPAVEPVVPIP